jgi:hypothetical protein
MNVQTQFPSAEWSASGRRKRLRLISLVSRPALTTMEPGSLVMKRKMLQGIKQRAEKLASGKGDRHA